MIFGTIYHILFGREMMVILGIVNSRSGYMGFIVISNKFVYNGMLG
jgi:hypothetical protein